MYKHECVQCLQEHKLKCPFNIGFIDRFLGNDNVKFCPNYLKMVEKK